MINIQLPHIAVQRVSNGYVVQWQQRGPDGRTRWETAVCADSATLVATVDRAAEDVSAVGGVT